MTPRLLRLLATALSLALAACGSHSPTQPKPPTIQQAKFAPSLGVDLSAMTKSESGLYVRDLVVGGDTAVARVNETVAVHYAGYLVNGTKFDENTAADSPFTFLLGAGRVIPGFDEGVTGMHVGGKRQLVIPSQLAYGPYPPDARIPVNAILVFTVELVAIE